MISEVVDTFTDVDGTALATHNPFWKITTGAIVVSSNQATQNTSPGPDAARWAGEVFNDQQYSQVDVRGLNFGASVGVCVRMSVSAAETYYYFMGTSTASALYKVVAGSVTQLGSTGGSFAVSDVIVLQVNSTTLIPLRNRAILSPPGVQTDSAIASGAPGIRFSGITPAAQSDNFCGGPVKVPHDYSNFPHKHMAYEV